ncbi:MAG: hypothetical protein FWE35_26130 [Streptosporangiales bacterium]|nr:hypothetical protein [Streptosporangiales bacterium]
MGIQSRGKDRFGQAQFHGELQAPPGFSSLVTVGMSVGGPVAIWSSGDGDAELHVRHERPGWASFPGTVPGTKPAVALVAYAGSGVAPSAVVRVPALPVAHPKIDVLADASFLVVGARCKWRESGPELNALAVGQNGQIFRRGCLGDGIQHLQVAEDGTIWTGYFDEGIFGNFGWGNPGPAPLGAGGIAAWSPAFEKVWDLDPREVEVDDCYAFNVGSDEVLACSYVDFPVIRIRNRQATSAATNGISGPVGIIASGDWVGLIGSYDDPSLLITGTIRDGKFRESERVNLRAPDGTPLPVVRPCCRGSVAHFFGAGKWYSFDLQDMD